MTATAAMMIADAAAVRSERFSLANAHPRNRATTGFTYA